MLTPEQAKALQDQRGYRSDERRRVQAVGALPEPLRPIAYGLLYRDAQGQPLPTDYAGQGARQGLKMRALAQIEDLTPQERTQIFGAFFLSLAEAVERGWVYLRSVPFTRQIYYRPAFFRASHRPDATLEARGIWLLGLVGNVGPHDDLVWLAHHAAYLQGHGGNQFGLLFAAAIDADPVHGDEVFDILLRSARGEDEIGTFGRHIPVALLAAARPDGWACVERLLLGAQREEGVRQIILEALDVARPEALRQLLGTILDQNLVRFSAVTYVVNGWLDTTWDSSQAPAVSRALRMLHTMLGDPDARRAALEDGSVSGEEAYLALWATACDDIYAALPLAERLLDDAAVARRYAAARLLAGAHIPEAIPLLLRALGDPDARVAAQACGGLRFDPGSYVGWDRGEHLRRAVAGAFERIEALLPRLPRVPKKAAPTQPQPQPQPLLWNAPAPSLDRERVADLLLDYLGERDPKRLIPHLGMFSAHGRSRTIDHLATCGLADPEVRTALFGLLKDRSSWVSHRALKVLSQVPIQQREAPILEALLGRKSEELRRGVLRLLLTQPDELVLASAERLMASNASEQQRLAGLEALRLLHEDGRGHSACATLAADYRQRRGDLTAAEKALLAPILEGNYAVPTLENALGLIDPADCSALPAPQPRPHAWTSPAAITGLLALDALIHEHRGDAYVRETYMGKQEAPLGSDVYYFPSPDAKLATEQDVARLPFADLWRDWAAARGAALRDEDGLDLLRMLVQIYRRGADETRAFLAEMGIADDASESPNGPNTSDANSPDNPDASAGPRLSLRYPGLLEKLCWWLVRLASASDPAAATRAADFILDHLETVLTEIPERELREQEDFSRRPYRQYQKLQRAVALARTHRELHRAAWADAQVSRLWRLLRWSATLPQPHLRYRPTAAETLAAYRAGAANETDLVYQFVGPRPQSEYRQTSFDELRDFSSRKPHPLLAEYPIACEIYARCARRVLEVELARGAMPTAATPAACSLRSVIGASWFVALLRVLGSDPLSRGAYYGYGEPSKAEALGHLLRVSFPAPDDTRQHLKTLLAGANIPQQRLIEAAVYAPQWAWHVEHVLGWAGFAEAVWWVHAHTKDRNWAMDAAVRQEWEARIGERTPLSGDDLYDGAVDVAWFQRVYTRLGAARWEAVYQAAKYSSSGTGHARARLFADAMLGTVDENTLTTRITSKRNRDAACALGLLPLPRGKQAHERALLGRYQVLQEFIRTARGFGAQRREGDQKGARIGLENLARTAGYPDAQRFQWAMELRAAADLREGAIHLMRGDVTLTLRLDALGQPHLDVARGTRLLKAIPGRLKQDPEVIALRERARSLEQQRARMRLALEQAMCREETFPAEELRALLGHPLLAPLLEQLVFVGVVSPVTPAGSSDSASAESETPPIMGYPVEDGGTLVLRSSSGEDIPVPAGAPLRIAHAYDLYRSGAWSQWQRECFAAERIQPFKQAFRELYVLTEAERRDGQIGQGVDAVLSRRYAGHQIQPRQGMALLGQRGWVTSVEDAGATRTFHGRGITASVEFVYGGGTPIDVEGLTIEGVYFHAAGNGRDGDGVAAGPMPLEAVAPVVFSEAMRDLDLVVSVAHRGGVDPEASASTVEMRAALIREVTAALGITNVQLPSDGAPEGANGTQGQGHRQGAHVRIQGELGEYALHLGSGTVHRLPGGAICIVPVQAQHPGRLFLPFTDDDPKTAEIVSKVLLLARDAEIRDPLILQQIYARV